MGGCICSSLIMGGCSQSSSKMGGSRDKCGQNCGGGLLGDQKKKGRGYTWAAKGCVLLSPPLRVFLVPSLTKCFTCPKKSLPLPELPMNALDVCQCIIATSIINLPRIICQLWTFWALFPHATGCIQFAAAVCIGTFETWMAGHVCTCVVCATCLVGLVVPRKNVLERNCITGHFEFLLSGRYASS